MEVYGQRPKFGTKEWFTNYFWYHYKWATLAAIFGVLVLIVFIKDMVTQEKYDMQVSVNTSLYTTMEQQQALEEVWESYAGDFDGDGTVNVGGLINYIPQGDKADPNLVMAGQTKFVVELSDGKSMILLFDEAIYQQIERSEGGGESFFEDLSSLSDKAYDNGIKIKLSDTPLGDDPLWAPVADELFITMRSHESPLVTKNEETLRQYEEERAVLENLLADRKTQS